MQSWMEQDLVVAGLTLVVYVAPGMGAPVHENRPSHGLVFQVGGSIRYTFADGSKLILQRQQMLYLPQGSSYRVDYLDQDEGQNGCYAINFFTCNPLRGKPFLFHPANPRLMMEHFSRAERAWHIHRPGDRTRCMSEMYAILSVMQSEWAASRSPKSRIGILEPAVRFMEEHYLAQHIAIAGLARMCGVSETYFRRLFAQCYGLPPHRFIIERRLARACELLASGEYPVKAVAELCGYGDECHFSREFKKTTGFSPAAYQKSNR